MSLSADNSGGVDAHPPVAVPRLGGITAVWLALLALSVIGAAPDREPLIGSVSGQVWQGLMWGSASVAVWMLATSPATARRRLLSVVVLASLFWWFHHCSGRPVHRYIISIGSFSLLQLATATILGWPGWSLGSQSLHAVHRYRFGIGGVMLVTAAIALVLSATREYQSPEEFFHGSRASAVGMVMVALASQMSMLSRRRAIWWVVATFVSLGLTVALLGSLHVLQVNRLQPPPQELTDIRDLFDADVWSYYLPPLFSFAVTVAVTAACGRMDHEMTVGRNNRSAVPAAKTAGSTAMPQRR